MHSHPGGDKTSHWVPDPEGVTGNGPDAEVEPVPGAGDQVPSPGMPSQHVPQPFGWHGGAYTTFPLFSRHRPPITNNHVTVPLPMGRLRYE